jgi:hypothetical protein
MLNGQRAIPVWPGDGQFEGMESLEGDVIQGGTCWNRPVVWADRYQPGNCEGGQDVDATYYQECDREFLRIGYESGEYAPNMNPLFYTIETYLLWMFVALV